VDKGLSVRQVEDEVRRRGEPTRSEKTAASSNIPEDVQDRIRDSFYGLLGVMPKIRDKGTGCVIEVAFKDTEELARLLDRLG
jgi:hypothetical protein